MSKKQKIHVKVGDIVVIISGFHKNETGEIIMDKKIIEKARLPVERMAAIGR